MVGNGSDIIATRDSWLHKKNDFQVEQSHRYEVRNEYVSNWFVPRTKKWDVDRVKENFHDEDAKVIPVPVSQRDVRDTVAWVRTKEGQYSVKMGANLEINNFS